MDTGTDKPSYDQFWQSLSDHLKQAHGMQRIVAPDPLHREFHDAVTPHDLNGQSFDSFAAISIHKGDYKSFPAEFLFHALTYYRPVFANEVFVVVANPNHDGLAKPDQAHTGSINVMLDWARNEVDPGVVAAAIPPHIELSPNETLINMAQLVALDLVKPITGYGPIAVAETAVPFENTNWYWGDDAAKVAELFCVPTLRRENPELVRRLIELIGSLSESSLIHRRIGPAEIQLEADDPADFRVNTPFVTSFGNLTQGRIRQGIRFNDGRTRPLVCFTPGWLQFRRRGKTHHVDLAGSVFRSSVKQVGSRVELEQVCTLRDPGNFDRELAVVHCNWTLDAGRNTIGFNLTLQPRSFTWLRNVVYAVDLSETTALGAFNRMTLVVDGVTQLVDLPAELSNYPSSVPDGDELDLARGAVDYLCLWEGTSIPGHSVGVHWRPGSGAKLSRISGLRRDDGELASMRMHYRAPIVTHSRPLRVSDERMVTAGGYYREAGDYQRLMNVEPLSGWCRDPSMSYDTGVELNAIATYLYFLERDEAGLSASEAQQLRSWFDRHLALYLDHVRPEDPNLHERTFVRGLAFVILALDTMARTSAVGAYREISLRLTRALLSTALPVPGKDDAAIFCNGASSRPELDSQCAALLALARMAFTEQRDPELSAAIERGVKALQIMTPATSRFGNGALDHPTLALGTNPADAEDVDTGFWTYKLGLGLRAFATIEHAVSSDLLQLSDEAQHHLKQLASVAQDALKQAARCHAKKIEVLTSVNAGETNSETQPWTALGLVPAIEEALLGVPIDQTTKLKFWL